MELNTIYLEDGNTICSEEDIKASLERFVLLRSITREMAVSIIEYGMKRGYRKGFEDGFREACSAYKNPELL